MVTANAVRREANQRLRAKERLGGKYSLERRIAVGGMGEIWVARNEMTGAQVALKVLRGDIDTKVEVEARFRHEARLGAMLAHRNIVRIFDLVEEHDGALVLVMELLRGETLRHYLKAKGPIDSVEAVALIMPLLSALEHAHEMGIVHRDLKPANIYLAVDPDGHVTPKLLDFGIAKLPMAGVQTLDGRVLGTPRYMSPEQIRSDQNIDGRSDLFSVGVLLVEMLTGQSPFFAKTPSASLAAVLEAQVDPDPRIDPKLWLVIQRALSKRPYERYKTAGEFAKALREATSATDEELAVKLRREKPARLGTDGAGATSGVVPSSSDELPENRDDDTGSPPVEVSHYLGRGGVGGGAGAAAAARLSRPSMRPPRPGDTAATDPSLLQVPGVSKGAGARGVMVGVAVALAVIAVLGGAALWRSPKKSAATTTDTTAATATTVQGVEIPPPPSPGGGEPSGSGVGSAGAAAAAGAGAQGTDLELPSESSAAAAPTTTAASNGAHPPSTRVRRPRSGGGSSSGGAGKTPRAVATTPGF